MRHIVCCIGLTLLILFAFVGCGTDNFMPVPAISIAGNGNISEDPLLLEEYMHIDSNSRRLCFGVDQYGNYTCPDEAMILFQNDGIATFVTEMDTLGYGSSAPWDGFHPFQSYGYFMAEKRFMNLTDSYSGECRVPEFIRFDDQLFWYEEPGEYTFEITFDCEWIVYFKNPSGDIDTTFYTNVSFLDHGWNWYNSETGNYETYTRDDVYFNQQISMENWEMLDDELITIAASLTINMHNNQVFIETPQEILEGEIISVPGKVNSERGTYQVTFPESEEEWTIYRVNANGFKLVVKTTENETLYYFKK